MTEKHVEKNAVNEDQNVDQPLSGKVDAGGAHQEAVAQPSLLEILNKTQVSSLFSMASFGAACWALMSLGPIGDKVNWIATDLNSLSVAVKPLIQFADKANQRNGDNPQALYPTDARTITVAATIAKRGVAIDDSKQYLEEVSRHMYQDQVMTVFMQNVAALGAPTAMVRASEDSITLYGKWQIDINESNKALLESFPREPLLVMDNESIPFPSCPDGTKEHIVYTTAYEVGTDGWETTPVLHKDVELRRWTFMFDESRPLSTESFEKRLLVLPNCRVVEAQNE